MVEKNPYETNGPVEVPNFMKEDKADKPDVDLSVFKLDEDEIEEDEEPRIKIKREYLIAGIAAAVLVILVLVLLFLNISKGKTISSWEQKYKTLETTSKATETRLNTEITNLTNENKTLKEENEKLKSSQSSGQSTGTTTGEKADGTLGAGTYVLSEGVYVRTGAGTSNPKIDMASASTNIKQLAQDNGCIGSGTTVKIIETKKVDNSVWGKIEDGCWICLVNNGTKYYK